MDNIHTHIHTHAHAHAHTYTQLHITKVFLESSVYYQQCEGKGYHSTCRINGFMYFFKKKYCMTNLNVYHRHKNWWDSYQCYLIAICQASLQTK